MCDEDQATPRRMEAGRTVITFADPIIYGESVEAANAVAEKMLRSACALAVIGKPLGDGHICSIGEDKEDDACSTCKDDFMFSNCICTSCNHLVCASCLMNSLNQQKRALVYRTKDCVECPTCKVPLTHYCFMDIETHKLRMRTIGVNK